MISSKVVVIGHETLQLHVKVIACVRTWPVYIYHLSKKRLISFYYIFVFNHGVLAQLPKVYFEIQSRIVAIHFAIEFLPWILIRHPIIVLGGKQIWVVQQSNQQLRCSDTLFLIELKQLVKLVFGQVLDDDCKVELKTLNGFEHFRALIHRT